MQYLGTLKRRMYLGHIDTDEKPVPGDSLYSSENSEQAIGRVVDAQPHPDGGQSALAVIQINAANTGDTHTGSSDGPSFTFESLPYSLAED